ncbi:von Willebrand factor D and EGF domain-containing protein-like [Mytilus edulis]|uniref:von Willebrand factor D and EGF domain-containing protein-like n=1 Tax=Mytilus edulis TaxID=6550 RepID=UPI0039EF7768
MFDIDISITFSVVPVVTPIEPVHDVAVAYKDDHMLKFKCNVTIPVANKGNVFDLKWDLNGKTIFPITKNIKEDDFERTAVLTANDLKREKQQMGFKLKCSVRARALPNSVPTMFIESKEFYAGIMVNTSTLTVNAGETAYVQIRSTVPITCLDVKNRKLDCFIRFEMLDYKAETAITSHDQFCKTKTRTHASRLCGVDFNARTWSTFQLLTLPTKSEQQIRDEYTAIVKLRSIGVKSDDLWYGYTLPDIKIKIRGKKFVPATCTSVTDPHITTFDHKSFTTFETGEYVLYKHLQKPVAVHVIHKSHGTEPRWNCAVAVQAGADTFIVYGCDRRWRHRRAFCDKIHGSNLDVYERNQGKDFEVHLPTGARVLIKVRGYPHSGMFERYIDVQIFASTLDENFTGGLCGKFNRNPQDDFTDPNGRVVNENKFKKSWHVDPADSLFIAQARKEVLQRSQYVCSCIHYSTPNPNGDLDTTADCNWDDSVKVCTAPTYSEQQCQYKHRREANDEMEIDIPEDIVIFKPAPPDSNKWKNGWNETAAKSHCSTVLHNSQMYKQCKDLVHFNESQAIQMCAEDIKVRKFI